MIVCKNIVYHTCLHFPTDISSGLSENYNKKIFNDKFTPGKYKTEFLSCIMTKIRKFLVDHSNYHSVSP